jgi:vitamin B12 transporter
MTAFRPLLSSSIVPLVALSLAAPLAAQQDTARGSGADTARVLLDPITVTGARAPAARTKIGSAVSIVTFEHLRQEPPFRAVDALMRLPGVFIEQAAGPGGPAIVRLRGGEEVFSLILMDGVQVNQNGGFFDFSGLSLTNFERVEVLRGPSSAMYGSTAVNGVVQFITRPGEPGPLRLSAAMMGGDAAEHGGQWQGTMAARGGSERLRYSGGLGLAYDRGVFALPHDVRTREGSLRLDVVPARGLELTAITRFMGVDGNLPIRDPGETRVPLDPNASNSRDRWVGLVRGSLTRGSLTHRVGASLYREAFTFQDTRDGVSHPNFFVFDADFRLDERLLRTTLDYQGTWEGRLGTLPAVLVAGAQWERENLRDRTAGDYGSDTLELARSIGAAFTEARISFGRLHTLAGLRLERVSDLATEATPRATAVFDVSEMLSLRGSVGRAYKAPNLQQQYLENPFIVANPDLRPERSWAVELGARVRDLGGFLLDVGWFRQEYQDLIRTVQSDDPARQINRNIGRARASGFEMEATLLTGASEFELNATIVRTRILDATGLNPREYPVGKALPFRPRITIGGAMFTPVAPHVELAVRATMIGDQVVLSERFSGRRVKLDAYTVLGATVTWQTTASFATFVRVDNLLGREYDTGFDRRGMPRTVAAGVRWGD